MNPLLCDDGWLECIKDFLLDALTPAVEALIKLIFDPILTALSEAVGAMMAAIGTFWVFVPTQAVGSATTGAPAANSVAWIWQHTQWIALFAATHGVIGARAPNAW